MGAIAEGLFALLPELFSAAAPEAAAVAPEAVAGLAPAVTGGLEGATAAGLAGAADAGAGLAGAGAAAADAAAPVASTFAPTASAVDAATPAAGGLGSSVTAALPASADIGAVNPLAFAGDAASAASGDALSAINAAAPTSDTLLSSGSAFTPSSGGLSPAAGVTPNEIVQNAFSDLTVPAYSNEPGITAGGAGAGGGGGVLPGPSSSVMEQPLGTPNFMDTATWPQGPVNAPPGTDAAAMASAPAGGGAPAGSAGAGADAVGGPSSASVGGADTYSGMVDNVSQAGGVPSSGTDTATKTFLEKWGPTLGIGGAALGSTLLGGKLGTAMTGPLPYQKQQLATAGQLTGLAGGQQAYGTALQQPLLTGVLPPQQQQVVDNAYNDSVVATKSRFAKLGLTGSTMEQDALNNLQNQKLAAQATLEQQMAQTGQAAISGAATDLNLQDRIYADLMNAQVAQDTALQNAISRFASAVGGAAAGQAVKSTLAA